MEFTSDRSQPQLDEFGIDIGSIHTTILTRVNQFLADVEPGGKEDGSKVLIQQLLPAVVTSVAVAVVEVLKNVLGKLADSSEKEKVRKLQRNLLLMKYENDRLAQYSRRETVRIVGLPEEEGEDLEKKVISLFKEEGADVSSNDISVVHRTGKKQKGRHVLVRFVSRKKRREVMVLKKNLKDKQGLGKVFLNDDLTPLRAKLLKYIRDSQRFGAVWTVDGKIYVSKKRPPGAQPDSRERPMTVESPDDLFRIGFDTIELEKLGLSELAVDED